MLGFTAGGEQFGLRDPVFALDPTGKRHVVADPDRLLWRPIRDLAKLVDTERMAGLLVLGPDALDQFEIIGLALGRCRNALRLAAGMKLVCRYRCGGNSRFF